MHKLYPQMNVSPLSCSINSEASPHHIDYIDQFFGALISRGLVVLYGSRTCHVLSELLCIHNLPEGLDGSDSSKIFIDGGNLFDPYYISLSARSLGLEPEKTLRNIWVSRAFTSYQMTSLLTEKLPEILDVEGSRLVVISDVAAPYCDPEVELFEATKTFNRVTCFLRNLAQKRSLLLVSTSILSRSRRKRILEQYLLGRADVALKIIEDKTCLKMMLEKHPSKSPVSADLYFRGGTQLLLEDCMEA